MRHRELLGRYCRDAGQRWQWPAGGGVMKTGSCGVCFHSRACRIDQVSGESVNKGSRGLDFWPEPLGVCMHH